MMDNQFEPTCLTVKATQSIHIENQGNNLHNFSIEGFAGVNVDVQPGSPFNGDPPGISPGTYTFFCKFHRTLGMQGTIIIT